MFSNAVRLFVLDGFEIKLDPSWFLIAGLITWTLATQYFPTTMPDQTGAAYLLLAIIAMLGFFSSLLLHELAHSVVARRFGVRINAITLFLFGGVAELENEPPSAMSELWIAAAGPAMSVVLGIIFWALGGLWQGIASSDGLGTVLVYLATVNLVIAVFNLVPAFPMDGGRILRAYLWHRHGDVLKATRTATRSGMFFGYFLMALGLMAVFQGAVAAGFWYVLIGFFVLGAARSAYQNQLMQSKFAGQTASDVMTEAGAQIIGGHTSMGAEFTIGFSVTGLAREHPITLAGAQVGDVLILTSPIGTGVLLAAEMQMTARGADVARAYARMSRSVAEDAYALRNAHAMTDVTGFGLVGHLANICRASGVGAELNARDVPLMDGALELSEKAVQSSLYPDNLSDALTMMNAPETPRGRLMLDPQTAGGLLAAIAPEDAQKAIAEMKEQGINAVQIGRIIDGPIALKLIE